MNNKTSLPDINVLYEDNHLIAVLKPAGTLVQGDKTGDESLLDITREWIRIKYQKPGNVFIGLVHRLDRPASGVVMFAKTSKGASRLSDQFRRHSPKKVYRIVVKGKLAKGAGTLKNYIIPGKGKVPSKIVRSKINGAKEAVLQYNVLQSKADLHELEVTLITGRKHQIRVQMANIGLPVVGDLKYGSKEKLAGGRAIALHAYSLCVEHPTRKEPVEVRSDVPDYWPI
jgi:23S rRNA pseudouridine1911/1915/1917 synthase